MQQEFSISTWWKIFLLPVVFLFSGLALNGLINGVHTIIATVVFLLILLLACWIVVSLLKSKIIVTADSITHVTALQTTTIALSEIRGMRVGEKSIRIEPRSADTAKITVNNYTFYGGSTKLTEWLKASFVDLDALYYKQELQAVMNDPKLGPSEQDRKQQLIFARNISLAYSAGGIAVLVSGFFLGSETATSLMLIYPLLSIPVILSSKGLIRFYSLKSSPYYHVLLGIAAPCIILVVKAAADYHLLSLQHFWLPFLLVSISFAAVFYLVTASQGPLKDKSILFSFLMIGGMYGFGSVVLVNCQYDHSSQQEFSARVLDHHISRGKSTTYYLTLSPWGPQRKVADASVSRYQYDLDPVGSTVNVVYQPGLLHIPWFILK